MLSLVKKVQWHNGIQNHQNRHPLLALDPNLTGYKAVELFQWEICLQCHSHSASTKVPTVDVGDKVKNFITQIYEIHGKDTFTIFLEAGKRIELKTFPKKALEIQTFLNYAARETYKNISLILHVMSPILFYEFKTPLMK
eukprot:12474366-Ditylum_brightwellii.AAC.1